MFSFRVYNSFRIVSFGYGYIIIMIITLGQIHPYILGMFLGKWDPQTKFHPSYSYKAYS